MIRFIAATQIPVMIGKKSTDYVISTEEELCMFQLQRHVF